ncbi:hypothetical protein GQ607_001875 [Colletotrichum asianum]|uniref:Uncharacterized protein n=1 Tax=Colletotrichum asianum TaxID=702518 RepID=A0A8H3WRG1_9PEZI|nr:hypothetical protein GQ607_001875 [Colletotrichum asianum]
MPLRPPPPAAESRSTSLPSSCLAQCQCVWSVSPSLDVPSSVSKSPRPALGYLTLGTEDVGSSCQLSVHVPPAVTCMAPQFFKLAQPVAALRLPTPAFTSPRHELDASHRVQRARDKGARLSLERIGWLLDRHTSSHLTAAKPAATNPKIQIPIHSQAPAHTIRPLGTHSEILHYVTTYLRIDT